VNVSGVGVEVANRFWVGAGVMLGVAVGTISGGTAVGVAISFDRSESDAQPERKIERSRI
jgi:hypothetical protein